MPLTWDCFVALSANEHDRIIYNSFSNSWKNFQKSALYIFSLTVKIHQLFIGRYHNQHWFVRKTWVNDKVVSSILMTNSWFALEHKKSQTHWFRAALPTVWIWMTPLRLLQCLNWQALLPHKNTWVNVTAIEVPTAGTGSTCSYVSIHIHIKLDAILNIHA
jgi:hypothetical protein